MTEPGVASSDASNVETSSHLEGGEWVINGEKYFISGAADPRCKILICMLKTNPEASRKGQQSQILVPMDTRGVQVLGPMRVFGADTSPQGHLHIRHNNVRVPRETTLIGERYGATN